MIVRKLFDGVYSFERGPADVLASITRRRQSAAPNDADAEPVAQSAEGAAGDKAGDTPAAPE